jgi:hypothetical protein
VAGSPEVDGEGETEVTVEKSQYVKGIYVVATERIKVEDPGLSAPAAEHARGARPAVQALELRWPRWVPRADEIVKSIAVAAREASQGEP